MTAKIKDLIRRDGFNFKKERSSMEDSDTYAYVTEDDLVEFAQSIARDIGGIYEAIDNGNKVEDTFDFITAVKRRYGV